MNSAYRQRLHATTPLVGSTHSRLAQGGASGFTSMELLVVLVIASVLAALAAPSFSNMMEISRTGSEVNNLANDLQLARSLAIQTGQNVSLCLSSNGTSCNVTNSDWASGWIVFTDANASMTVTANDVVIREQQRFSGTDTFVANPATNALSFNRSGMASGLQGNVVFAVKTARANPAATRCLALNVVGRQQLQTPTNSPGTCK